MLNVSCCSEKDPAATNPDSLTTKMSAGPGPAGVVGTVTSPFNGWYRRDPCVARKEFRPDRFYLLDGGMGTALEARRPASGSDDPLWSCGMTYTDPDSVRQVHSAFLSAGADIVTTNTYQCSRELFKYNHPAILQWHKKIVVSCPASLPIFFLLGSILIFLILNWTPRVCLAGRCSWRTRLWTLPRSTQSWWPRWVRTGPANTTGQSTPGSTSTPCLPRIWRGMDAVVVALLPAILWRMRNSSPSPPPRWHFERINRLAAAGATFLAVETIPALAEASAILNVVQSFPGLRCWVSFQCRDGKTTAKGEPFDRVVRELLRHPTCPNKLVAVGVNCVAPKDVAPLLRLANRVNRYAPKGRQLDIEPLIFH